MKKYELWIDESGSFNPEDERRSDSYWQPSLVGGILIEQGKIQSETVKSLVQQSVVGETAHATEMDRAEIEKVVLPALEALVARGAKLVYFENKEHIDMYQNGELYLRLLAGGLVRLMEHLAQEGDFILSVTIAVRYVPQPTGNPVRIDDEEYVQTLQYFIRESWKKKEFDISEDCRLNISIQSARKETRLMLADFACNSHLTRSSKKFSAALRERYEKLIDPAYIWSIRVNLSVHRILAALAGGDIAVALLEYYTGHGEFDHSAMFAKIFDRIRQMSYRLNRLQLNEFVTTIRAYILAETDFESGEALLKRIIRELIPAYHSRKIEVQTDAAQFWLLLCLADMYLREGDLNEAKEVLDQLETLIHAMNYRVENLWYVYFYNDKKALYKICCMEYEEAVETINRTIHSMEAFISILEADDHIAAYFQNDGAMNSEYLGNAYCMKVYAEMFLQRGKPELYEQSLRADTEKALAQYEYNGELERNLQYRAHVEMEAGHYEEALRWLLKTQVTEPGSTVEELVSGCVEYLREAGREDRLSRCYYMMYYIEIMYEARRNEVVQISELMEKALRDEYDLSMQMLSLYKPQPGIYSDSSQKPRIYEDILGTAIGRKPVRYHPLEIVYWKYGSFLWISGRSKEALHYWKAAIDICEENPGYEQMRMIHIAIALEKLSCLRQTGKRYKGEYEAGLRALRGHCNRLLQQKNEGNWPPKMLDYVGRALSLSQQFSEQEAWLLSREIAF